MRIVSLNNSITAFKRREHEAELSCLNSCGIPKALAAINRKPKQETFGLIPDDGFVSTLSLLTEFRESSKR